MSRLSGHRIAIVASAALMVGTAGSVGAASTPTPPPGDVPSLADVPLFRMNTAANAIQPGPGPTGTPELAWKASIGDMHMIPILVDGLVIAGTNDGRLVALDPRTGETRWDKPVGGGQIMPTLAAMDGLVVGSDGTSVFALEVGTGKERWSHPVDGASGPRLDTDEGVVYVGTTDGVVGLDALSGNEVWRWDEGPADVVVAPGPTADGVGYFAAGDGRVYAVDVLTGDVRWALPTISTSIASGQIVGDTFYVNTGQSDTPEPSGEVYAVDRASGDVRWRFRTPSGTELAQGPFKDGVLYASGTRDGIWALRDDASSVTVLWHVDAPEAHWPMALVDDTLYEARTDGSVGAYAIGDGSLLWETPALGAWADGPIVSGGMVFVGDEADGMMAFADPSLISKLPDPLTQSSPTPGSSVDVAANPFTVVRSFSWASTGIGTPLGMDPGPDGLLYVLDTTPQVTVIDPNDGHVVRRWGQHGAGPGEFDVARFDDNPGFGDISVAPDGRVYVADGSNNRIQVFEPDGTFDSQFGSFGTGQGQFEAVEEIEVGPDGAVYARDRHGISKFTPDGKFVWRTEGAGGIAVRSDGVIVGTCPGCRQLLLLDPVDGHLIERIDLPQFDGDGFGPVNLDQADNVYINAFGSGSEIVFDRTGTFLGADYTTSDDELTALRQTIVWGDTWWPSPVFLSDGLGYVFGKDGLLELRVQLPAT